MLHQINPPVQYVAAQQRSRLQGQQLENTPRNSTDRRSGNRRVLLDGDPEYTHTAYLDAHCYSEMINKYTELNKVIKRYVQGKIAWGEVIKIVVGEGVNIRNKKPRLRNGHWMKNRRDN